MIHYDFPLIKNIDDVLPHIQGSTDFIVAEREKYTVVNYNVVSEDTFPSMKVSGGSEKMRQERILSNAIRRECRGLIFDKNGLIMSRPYHKFFNINEREETFAKNIDLSRIHVVLEKIDGSMIRPLLIDGNIRLATKMGITDVSMNAEEWLLGQHKALEKLAWLKEMVINGYTPIFEWVSYKNQIVVAYEEEDLILTGIRETQTGRYCNIFDFNKMFNTVKVYGFINHYSIEDYISEARIKTDREGDIIRFSSGHMVKMKNDWYVRIHKVIDNNRFDRNIVDLVLNEKIDDVLSMLPKAEFERCKEVAKKFWEGFNNTLARLEEIKLQISKYNKDRKRIALEYVPKLADKRDSSFVFRMIEEEDVRSMLLDHVRKNLGTNVRWEECANWMGIK